METQRVLCKIWSVVLFVFIKAAPSWGDIHINCSFPEILNPERGMDGVRVWRFLSPDPTYSKDHKTGQWSFHPHSVYVSHGHSRDDYDSADGYDYDCIEKVNKNKVLVKRIEFDSVNKRDKFTCLHFIQRSAAVIQIRASDFSDTADTKLCTNENLKNNDITLVHSNAGTWYSVLEQIPYMSCGLKGGYRIDQWWDEEGKEGCTLDVKNSLRVEDECDVGSGLQITGQTGNCPSPMEGLNEYSDKLTCIAQWKDRKYAYSVATDEFNTFFVCLRTPKKMDTGNGFEMYLFLDGICDSTHNIAHSKIYRRISLKKYVVSDICANAAPRCDLLGQDDCKGFAPDLCRETCNVCPKERPWHNVKLPSNIQGTWLLKADSEHPGNKVTISDRVLQFPNLGAWWYYGPSKCIRARVGHQNTADEYVFVSTSVNGCRPRVATVMVNTFSKSVIGVQFSQSSAFKLGMVNGTAVWSDDMLSVCLETDYSQDKERLRDKYHTSAYGWKNLVKMDQYPKLAQCKTKRSQSLEILFGSGAICKGEMKLKRLGDTFDLEVNDCGESNNTIDFPGGLMTKVTYECMARFKGANDWTTYMITRTPGELKSFVNETFVCWYFPSDRNGYLLPVSGCDDMTNVDISLDEKSPLARVQLEGADVVNRAVTGKIFPTQMIILLLIIALLSCLS